MNVLVIFVAMLLGVPLVQDSTKAINTEEAFTVYAKDSVPIQVNLVLNKEMLPLQYYSYVVTPVCEEGTCYNITICIYWDLLGNFVKYDLPPKAPLTKFDHVEFTKDDHKKMYEILTDKASLLRDYAAEDLIDRKIKIVSQIKEDAVTGATNKSIEGAVVRGAVYSSHTLWHIVNGEAATKIVQHTKKRFNKQLLVYMFNSDNYHYQYYALNAIPTEDIKDYIPYIIRLVSEGEEYVPYFAIEKLPEYVWKLPKYQEVLVKLLDRLNFEMQNEVLNKINEVELSAAALNTLVLSLKSLKESQQIKVVGILTSHKMSLIYENLLSISSLITHPNEEIANQVYLILKTRSVEFKGLNKVLDDYNKPN